MAKAKAVGKDGIDAWTSNGYGLAVDKEDISKDRKEEIDKLNDEIRKFVNDKK